MKKTPKILLTNDDGILAPGLKHLWECLHEEGFNDLIVVAPSLERSGTGVSITWDKPILIKKFPWANQASAWSVEGTPADCVKMAIRIIMESPPDLILSGINAGSNAGRNVLHSGTIGAVIEGVLRNIPGIAFSCENGDNPNYHVAKKYIGSIVNFILEHPLENGSFLNVNFPQAVEDLVRGFKFTRQGKGRWAEDPALHVETEQDRSFWLGGKPEELDEEPDCDISFLRKGYLTAVPIHVHELTSKKELERRKDIFEEFLIKKNGKVKK